MRENAHMAKNPTFAAIGKKTGSIDVLLSYKIVALFSEGLYASPNKAIEELVANAFDAGAQNVHVMLSGNLNAQNATIVVADDGEGMNAAELKQHWLIGSSNKRDLAKLPRGRQQIGKFGIGKLATYVLAGRLTHITKSRGKYFSTSMDYSLINPSGKSEVVPKKSIRIPLRTLSEKEAKQALTPLIDAPTFKKMGASLFGKRASTSWTVAIMSALKPKAQELKLGTLEWVLRTALPLRPDVVRKGDRQKFLDDAVAGVRAKEKFIRVAPAFQAEYVSRIGDKKFINSIKKYREKTEVLYRRAEALRVTLAKHEVPRTDRFFAEAPGYGRMDLMSGSIYWHFTLKDNTIEVVNRRKMANEFLGIED
jgi:hypothetical protein